MSTCDDADGTPTPCPVATLPTVPSVTNDTAMRIVYAMLYLLLLVAIATATLI